MRRLAPLVAFVSALTLTGAAGAVGPTLPAVEGGPGVSIGDVSYVTHLAPEQTTILAKRRHGRVVSTRELPGRWGVPLVTYGSPPGGLSPDGRVLVLSDAVDISGRLRARSRFAVVDTRTLSLTRTITLRGDYSFDALSPQAKTLYLIHHVSNEDATKYQVQAYDLGLGRLLPRVIADRRQAGWIMDGFPVTRATSAGGRWVYTFYRQNENYPFVHALDTVDRTAICIGIPADWVNGAWIDGAKLRLAGGKLLIAGPAGKLRYALDTKTFRVTTA